MRCYVINLRRRPDRRARMAERLPPELDVVYTTDWPGPLDGRTITPKSLRGFKLFPWRIDSQNPWWNRPLKRGEIGCAISHWRCWTHAAAEDVSRALIFEDDALVKPSFYADLQRALAVLDAEHGGWDLLYVARTRVDQRLNLPPAITRDVPVGHGMVRPGYSWCARGYVLSSAGIQKLLAANFDQAIIPADEFIPAMYGIHPRADVARRYHPCLHAYALHPPIVGKMAEFALDSDTEASEFMELA